MNIGTLSCCIFFYLEHKYIHLLNEAEESQGIVKKTENSPVKVSDLKALFKDPNFWCIFIGKNLIECTFMQMRTLVVPYFEKRYDMSYTEAAGY